MSAAWSSLLQKLKAKSAGARRITPRASRARQRRADPHEGGTSIRKLLALGIAPATLAIFLPVYTPRHRICHSSHKPHTCDRRIDHANKIKRAEHRAKRQRIALNRRWNSMEVSQASWFGGESTACGAYIASGVAHKTLPCGTKVRICISRSDCIVAQVMDRGPYIAGREWDLGEEAKDALGCDGVCTVHAEVLRRR